MFPSPLPPHAAGVFQKLITTGLLLVCSGSLSLSWGPRDYVGNPHICVFSVFSRYTVCLELTSDIDTKAFWYFRGQVHLLDLLGFAIKSFPFSSCTQPVLRSPQIWHQSMFFSCL